ncbi:hypothetical protein [Marinifilum caeruleilacunae]|uniref:Glycine zipper family protein n=1 Tax=Marinifilum caeruleilacunae TaxID=2499076 RepID=A0ABX1X0M7_9BACT|nr:hypothetical protein [Marinifilum caeruleilacunae]NOU61854.1 hypothetical protein [Marinifilum caeruleilacunae]
MKKQFVLLLLLGLGVGFIYSCSKNEDTTNTNEETLKVSNYSKIGDIHNQFLTNVKNNFEAIDNGEDVDEKIDFINNFNKKFVSTLEISSTDKTTLIGELNKHKELVVESNVKKVSFGNVGLKSGDPESENLLDLIERLKSDNQINSDSYRILSDLYYNLKLNYNRELSDYDLKLNVEKLITEFNNVGYDAISQEGHMLATVLAISISSLEWWEENPDAYGNTKVAPWVAADIGGAIYGGIYGGITGGSWESAGWGALGGAIAGSTGIAGRIGKYLSRLL